MLKTIIYEMLTMFRSSIVPSRGCGKSFTNRVWCLGDV